MVGSGKVFLALMFFALAIGLFPTASRAGAGGAGAMDYDSLDPDPFAGEAAGPVVKVRDPIEPVNRFFFTVNDRLYFWLIKPVAQGYEAVMPDPLEEGISNFFSNLKAPIRMVNNLLQAEFRGFGTESGRFIVNSTIGLAGFFDVADRAFALKPRRKDLGQTLGRYGIGDGFYICWPVFGSSSLRDSVGLAGDSYLSPLSYLAREDFRAGAGAYSLKTVNAAEEKGEVYEDMKKSSLDPYIAARTAYFQYRASRVRNEILD